MIRCGGESDRVETEPVLRVLRAIIDRDCRRFLTACAMGFAAMLLAACAVDRSEAVETELRRVNLKTADGIRKIEHSLIDPHLTSSELAEGVRAVESGAQRLRALEIDERANDVQQLMAIVAQARAWDEVARTFERAAPSSGLDPGQKALVAAILDEKALPARAQAGSGYRRALERACHSNLEALPVMLEILDGMARYKNRSISLDRPCAEQ